MTREQAKELFPIIQAFAEGKTIQFKYPDMVGWCDVIGDIWVDTPEYKYRIKPEPREFWINEYARARHPELESPAYPSKELAQSICSVNCIGQIHLREVLD